MKYLLIFVCSLLLNGEVISQNENPMKTNTNSNEELPYRQIPDYPDTYTPGNVAARMVDGLGYRYYWATEGLTEKDLDYKPSEDGRRTGETLDHILGLSLTIVNSVENRVNTRFDRSGLSFEQKRKMTLENIKKTSEILKRGEGTEIEGYKIIFQRGEKTTEFPYWNMLTGPIADAIYHTGQVVSYRRSSGNPMDPGVNVFIGKTRQIKEN